MQFNEKALQNKNKYLDIILNQENEELLKKVVQKNIGKSVKIRKMNRVWNPGGGSTLFIIEFEGNNIFLKVKHKSVTVESKLEGEKAFSSISSLENEYSMLKLLNGKNVPAIVFFEENAEIQFLATEYIDYSLIEALELNSIGQILNLWNQIVDMIYQLYNNGIVHCDLHENNIRVRKDNIPVLIDLEETRKFQQKGDFKNSLDYVGKNYKSSVGIFPDKSSDMNIKGYNCLIRLKEVFKKYILQKMDDLVAKCYYDSTNGICNTLDHGKSDKVYQSINTKYFKVDGQRGENDNRASIVAKIIKIIFRKQRCTYVDIGSNNGNFCRKMSDLECVTNSIGLEGFSEFNKLACALAFLEDCDKTEFIDFVCGKSELQSVETNQESVVMSIFSVWHHIDNKEKFLKEIRDNGVEVIILEMAVQKECYLERTWDEEVNYISTKSGMPYRYDVAQSKDFTRPIIVLTRKPLNIWKKMNIFVYTKIC